MSCLDCSNDGGLEARRTDPREVDCLVIGGGPAGLTAAIYLARYRRGVVVIDAGGSRAALIPKTHNYPGFAGGISGPDLLAELASQATRYGVEIHQGKVERLEPAGERLLAATGKDCILASKVVLATGIADDAPPVSGLADLVASGRIRFCPICDAFEATGKRIAVLGPRRHALPKAIFMRTYARDVVLVGFDEGDDLDPEARSSLDRAGVRLATAIFRDIVADPKAGHIGVLLADGQRIDVDVLYPAMGAMVHSELAQALGARCNPAGCVLVDAKQRTSVSHVYAIGDVTVELHQLSVAIGHAAVAATDIHNSLRPNYL